MLCSVRIHTATFHCLQCDGDIGQFNHAHTERCEECSVLIDPPNGGNSAQILGAAHITGACRYAGVLVPVPALLRSSTYIFTSSPSFVSSSDGLDDFVSNMVSFFESRMQTVAGWWWLTRCADSLFLVFEVRRIG